MVFSTNLHVNRLSELRAFSINLFGSRHKEWEYPCDRKHTLYLSWHELTRKCAATWQLNTCVSSITCGIHQRIRLYQMENRLDYKRYQQCKLKVLWYVVHIYTIHYTRVGYSRSGMKIGSTEYILFPINNIALDIIDRNPRTCKTTRTSNQD